MQTLRAEFDSSAGEALSGLLDVPDEDPKAYALFAHCFTCGKSLGVIRNIAKQLTSEGIALLRFDFTGLGQSEGEFAKTTFTTNTADLVAAAQFLEREYTAPAVLIGHSLGGAAVLSAANLIPSAKCVATIGAPADPVHVRQLLTGAAFGDGDVAEISIGGRPFKIGRQFIKDLEEHDLADRIGKLKRPLLVFHSPVDVIVGIENAEKIFKAAKHPQEFRLAGKGRSPRVQAGGCAIPRARPLRLGRVLRCPAGNVDPVNTPPAFDRVTRDHRVINASNTNACRTTNTVDTNQSARYRPARLARQGQPT